MADIELRQSLGSRKVRLQRHPSHRKWRRRRPRGESCRSRGRELHRRGVADHPKLARHRPSASSDDNSSELVLIFHLIICVTFHANRMLESIEFPEPKSKRERDLLWAPTDGLRGERSHQDVYWLEMVRRLKPMSCNSKLKGLNLGLPLNPLERIANTSEIPVPALRSTRPSNATTEIRPQHHHLVVIRELNYHNQARARWFCNFSGFNDESRVAGWFSFHVKQPVLRSPYSNAHPKPRVESLEIIKKSATKGETTRASLSVKLHRLSLICTNRTPSNSQCHLASPASGTCICLALIIFKRAEPRDKRNESSTDGKLNKRARVAKLIAPVRQQPQLTSNDQRQPKEQTELAILQLDAPLGCHWQPQVALEFTFMFRILLSPIGWPFHSNEVLGVALGSPPPQRLSDLLFVVGFAQWMDIESFFQLAKLTVASSRETIPPSPPSPSPLLGVASCQSLGETGELKSALISYSRAPRELKLTLKSDIKQMDSDKCNSYFAHNDDSTTNDHNNEILILTSGQFICIDCDYNPMVNWSFAPSAPVGSPNFSLILHTDSDCDQLLVAEARGLNPAKWLFGLGVQKWSNCNYNCDSNWNLNCDLLLVSCVRIGGRLAANSATLTPQIQLANDPMRREGSSGGRCCHYCHYHYYYCYYYSADRQRKVSAAQSLAGSKLVSLQSKVVCPELTTRSDQSGGAIRWVRPPASAVTVISSLPWGRSKAQVSVVLVALLLLMLLVLDPATRTKADGQVDALMMNGDSWSLRARLDPRASHQLKLVSSTQNHRQVFGELRSEIGNQRRLKETHNHMSNNNSNNYNYNNHYQHHDNRMPIEWRKSLEYRHLQRHQKMAKIQHKKANNSANFHLLSSSLSQFDKIFAVADSNWDGAFEASTTRAKRDYHSADGHQLSPYQATGTRGQPDEELPPRSSSGHSSHGFGSTQLRPLTSIRVNGARKDRWSCQEVTSPSAYAFGESQLKDRPNVALIDKLVTRNSRERRFAHRRSALMSPSATTNSEWLKFNSQLNQHSTPHNRCATECQCTWKNGKQSADCSKAQMSLRKIPEGLDPLTQVLNLSSNELSVLKDSTFNQLNLNNLQRVYLSQNQLESIELRAFEKLKLIVELDFSWNKLKKVPLIQISRLSLLRRLSMRGNSLLALTESTFTWTQLTPKVQQEVDDVRFNMSCLYETYPELSKSLAKGRLFGFTSNSSALDDDDQDSNLGKGFSEQPNTEQRLTQLGALRESLSEAEALSSDFDDNSISQADETEVNYLQGHGQTGDSVPPLGAFFEHLQELDFGFCSLRYIKWTTLRNLNQLKRLLLDNNQLSQLSGKLVATLPVGLHQLTLEGNQWTCDCRLMSLRRWLLSTKTPLSAPVKCETFDSSLSQRRHESRRRIRSSIGTNWSVSRRFQAVRLETQSQASNSTPTDGQSMEDPTTLKPSTSTHQISASESRLNMIEPEIYLDRLNVEDFVCPPRAIYPTFNGKYTEQPIDLAIQSTSGNLRNADVSRPMDSISEPNELADLTLDLIFAYLAPTLVHLSTRSPEIPKNVTRNELSPEVVVGRAHESSWSSILWSRLASGHRKEDHPRARFSWTLAPSKGSHRHRIHTQLNEGDRMVLRCSFLAYPEASLHLIWLADFGGRQVRDNQNPQLASDNQFQSGERFVVLYDSRLHRAIGQQPQELAAGDASRELLSTDYQNGRQLPKANVSLNNHELLVSPPGTNSRLIVKESQAANGLESIHKESQIIIEAARVEDSARYKCIGLNSAGNSSIEHQVRVIRSSRVKGEHLAPSASRDQRAHDETSNHQQQQPLSLNQNIEQRQTDTRIVNKPQQVQAQHQQQSQSPPSAWLKSSTAFQIVFVLVSVLMAGVIIAFIVVCIVIYQIKPTALSGANRSAPPPIAYSSVVNSQAEKSAGFGDRVDTPSGKIFTQMMTAFCDRNYSDLQIQTQSEYGLELDGFAPRAAPAKSDQMELLAGQHLGTESSFTYWQNGHNVIGLRQIPTQRNSVHLQQIPASASSSQAINL